MNYSTCFSPNITRIDRGASIGAPGHLQLRQFTDGQLAWSRRRCHSVFGSTEPTASCGEHCRWCWDADSVMRLCMPVRAHAVSVPADTQYHGDSLIPVAAVTLHPFVRSGPARHLKVLL